MIYTYQVEGRKRENTSARSMANLATEFRYQPEGKPLRILIRVRRSITLRVLSIFMAGQISIHSLEREKWNWWTCSGILSGNEIFHCVKATQLGSCWMMSETIFIHVDGSYCPGTFLVKHQKLVLLLPHSTSNPRKNLDPINTIVWPVIARKIWYQFPLLFRKKHRVSQN